MATRAHWQDQPEEHDYPAARDYLSLLMSEVAASELADRLRAAPIVLRKAKDLLRASGLPVLGPDNVHVGRDLAKVRDKRRLSPVLLVRGAVVSGIALTVADGYHRICASHHIDEDADIPCRIVDLTRS
jgi:hypothetical protein